MLASAAQQAHPPGSGSGARALSFDFFGGAGLQVKSSPASCST